MDDEGGDTNKNDNLESWDLRKQKDRKLLRFFLICTGLLLFINIAVEFIILQAAINSLIDGSISSVTFSFFFTGILALKYNNKNDGRIIPTKKVLNWFSKIALIFAFAFMAVIYVFEILPNENDEPFTIHIIILFSLYFAGFVTGFLIQLVMFITGFGVMGIISTWLRGGVPDILVEIKKITPNTSDSMKEKNKKVYGNYSRLGWFFNIPDVIDTKTLSIKHSGSSNKFPWVMFKRALKWEIFLGTILVIYISFNPFLLNVTDITWLISLSLNISFIIPMLVLPWFIFLRLEAKIKGPVRDFSLFSGLSQRVVQSLVAFGTIILIVRFGLRDRDILDMLASFLGYYTFFIVIAVIFTFVYFNYFNEDLARDIVKRYEKIKD